MTEVVARLDGITRHFGHVKALDSANLQIHSGEIHGILGENGAGKTTLLSILGGIIHPDVGFLEVGGSRVRLQVHGPPGKWGLAWCTSTSLWYRAFLCSRILHSVGGIQGIGGRYT